MCSWVVSQEPLCRKDVPSMDKVTFSTNKKTDQIIIVNSGKMQNRIMQRLSFFFLFFTIKEQLLKKIMKAVYRIGYHPVS